jgi:hypothetical protein
MTADVRRFYSSVENSKTLNDIDHVEHFVYFLTEVAGRAATSKSVEQCFKDCKLKPPSTIAQMLNRGLSSSPKRYVKVTVGYELEYHRQIELAQKLGAETHTIQIPAELRTLQDQLPNGPGKDWFKEAMDCYGVEAYRAALIMTWIFALDHLLNYVLAHKLADFNTALSAHPDQRTARKVGTVAARDDFGPIGEEMLLDLLKTAKIISGDVRRLMGVALGVRNTAAHPSGVVVTRNKFITTAEELVLNVVLKYPI